jgi:hypothetical protein
MHHAVMAPKGNMLPISATGGYAMVTYIEECINKEPS